MYRKVVCVEGCVCEVGFGASDGGVMSGWVFAQVAV